jgi:hypothetical protein
MGNQKQKESQKGKSKNNNNNTKFDEPAVNPKFNEDWMIPDHMNMKDFIFFKDGKNCTEIPYYKGKHLCESFHLKLNSRCVFLHGDIDEMGLSKELDEWCKKHYKKNQK